VLPVIVGVNPRTGIDRCRRFRRGDRAPLTVEQAERFLELDAVFDPDEKTPEQDAAETERHEETERLTRKQALLKEAGELGLEVNDKMTIPQLEAVVEEKKATLADGPADGTGGPDPDAK
jgi:hypothetical protein